ncbi:MAG: substrate-binding periplasmic protein [Cognaticolwellia sp.]
MHRLLIAVLYLCILSVESRELPPLKVVTEQIAPYQFHNSDGELSGFSVEMINALFDEIDYRPEIVVLPWARAYEIAKNEANVVVFSLARTKHRESMFHWIGSITHEKFAFWGLKSKFTKPLYNLEKLKKYKTGIARFSYTEQYLLDKGFDNIARLVKEEQNIQMLYNNRVDLIIASDITVRHRAQRLGLNYDDFVKVYSADELTTDLSVALSINSDPAWVKRLQNSYQTLENKGIAAAIRKKWL